MKANNRTRRGFTLIELLVAAGLSMLIMAMVTAAFQRGMDVLSELKSVGEMQQRLRSAEIALRADLEADHFGGRGQGIRVSDQRLDLMHATPGLTNDTARWRPPQMGFFSIRQGTNLSIIEGLDNDGNICTRSTDHVLYMTVVKNATRGDKIFSTRLSPALGPVNMAAMNSMSISQMTAEANAMVSDWCEVVYFLDKTRQVGTTEGGLPLYGLYRRTRVIANSGTPNAISWGDMTNSLSNKEKAESMGISYAPAIVGSVNRPMNDPQSVRNPYNRLGGITQARTGNFFDVLAAESDGNGNLTGSDLLLQDVISFEVKADWDVGFTTVPGTNSVVQSAMRPGENRPGLDDLSRTFEFPFSDLPTTMSYPNPTTAPAPRNSAVGGTTRIFDTWFDTADDSWLRSVPTLGTANAIPQPIRLRAIQVKVRVWDRKNKMARQMTIVQSL